MAYDAVFLFCGTTDDFLLPDCQVPVHIVLYSDDQRVFGVTNKWRNDTKEIHGCSGSGIEDFSFHDILSSLAS